MLKYFLAIKTNTVQGQNSSNKAGTFDEEKNFKYPLPLPDASHPGMRYGEV